METFEETDKTNNYRSKKERKKLKGIKLRKKFLKKQKEKEPESILSNILDGLIGTTNIDTELYESELSHIIPKENESPQITNE